MKEQKSLRSGDNSDEYVKRPAKLEPIRKSGKVRHTLYDDDLADDDDVDLTELRPRESAYDYFDDPQ